MKTNGGQIKFIRTPDHEAALDYVKEMRRDWEAGFPGVTIADRNLGNAYLDHILILIELRKQLELLRETR